MNDQYTPLHNEVLEALAKINLSPYETRVLFVIWRKTYGFIDKKTGLRKKIDWIAGSQISEMTDLDRRHVSRALKGLKEKHVISRDDKKTGFSKEFMKLMSSIEMTKEEMSSVETPPVEMTPTPSRDDKLSSVEGHTKEKKETYTKERNPQLFYKTKEYLNKIVEDKEFCLKEREEHFNKKSQINISVVEIQREAEKSINWLKANGKTKKDYRAFLHNWLIKSYGYMYKS